MAGEMEAHLSMIQGVVNRLAQSSFLLKGWSVVLVSALLAFAAASSEGSDPGRGLPSSPGFLGT